MSEQEHPLRALLDRVEAFTYVPEVEKVRALLDSGDIAQKVECDACCGSGALYHYGKRYENQCPACHGTGYVWEVIE